MFSLNSTFQCVEYSPVICALMFNEPSYGEGDKMPVDKQSFTLIRHEF